MYVCMYVCMYVYNGIFYCHVWLPEGIKQTITVFTVEIDSFIGQSQGTW